MADEYIRREDTIEEIDKWLDAVGTVFVGKNRGYYGELIGCIKDAPAADVAPVVRCKDCANSRVTESGKRYCKAPLGMYGAVPVGDDYFCNNGKRHDDGENENENN